MARRKVFTNGAVSTLGAQLAGGAVSLIFEGGTGQLFALPQAEEEQMLVLRTGDWAQTERVALTSRSGDSGTVERGREGTSGTTTWPAGTIVEAVNSAEVMESFAQREQAGLNDLADATIANPQHGQGLIFNTATGEWENQFSLLDQSSDVVLTSPQVGQVLTYDGANWVNQTPAGGGGGESVAFYARFRDDAPGSNQAIGAADVWQQIQTQSYEAYEYLNVQEPSEGTGYDVTVQATVGPAYRTLLSATVLIQISTAGQRVDIDYGRNGSRLHTARAFVSCSEPGIHQLTLPTIEIHAGAGDDVFSLFIKSNLTNSVIIGENMYYIRGMS